MSTPWILRRLYTLDTSSVDFLRYLYSLIRHDEEERYLANLQGPQLARLLDFLDEVRALPSAFCPVMKQIIQALSAVSADDDLSRQCLHKLQAICAHRTTLPSSYIISRRIARVGRGLITLGGIADVWEGAYRRRRVSIKSLKTPLNDNQIIKKVCI